METDWSENRADLPVDPIRGMLGKFSEILYTTYTVSYTHLTLPTSDLV